MKIILNKLKSISNIRDMLKKRFIAFLEKIIGLCNTIVMAIGLLIVIISPIVALGLPLFPMFDWINRSISVLITTIGCTLGTMLVSFGYMKVKNDSVKKEIENMGKENYSLAKLKEQYDKQNKELVNAIFERNEAKKESNHAGTKIKTLEGEVNSLKEDKLWLKEENEKLQSMNTVLKENLNYEKLKVIEISAIRPVHKTISCEMKYDRYNFKEKRLSSKEGSSFHRPKIEFYRGVFHMSGTLYYGTDLDELKLGIDKDKNVLIVYGNLNNFKAMDTKYEEDWKLKRIEVEKYEPNTDIENSILPGTRKEVTVLSLDSQDLEKECSIHKAEAKNEIVQAKAEDALQMQIEEFTKKYLEAILNPICYKYGLNGITFQKEYKDVKQLMPFYEYVDDFNATLKLEREKL